MGNRYRPSVFVLHSKGVPSHRTLVDRLKSVAYKLNIPLADYAHWTWEHEDGKSDAEIRRDVSRLLSGERYFKELGWVSGEVPVEMEFLTGGRFNPRHAPQRINDQDLKKLLCGADVLLFAEDDTQTQLPPGVLHEIELLRKSSDSSDRRARRISARIASARLSETLHGPEVLQPPIELSIDIDKLADGDLDTLGIELTSLAVVIFCADRSSLRYLEPERRDRLVQTPLPCEPNCYFLTEPDAYIESVVDNIARSANARVHATLFTIIDALWSESLYYSMCKQVTTSCQRPGATSQARHALRQFIKTHPAGMWADVAVTVQGDPGTPF